MQEINLNYIPDQNATVLRCSQNDVGRKARFHLFEDGVPFDIAADMTATIRGTKPNGLGFSVPCQVDSANDTVTVTLTAEMTESAGKFPVDIEIYSEAATCYTANMWMWVEKNPHPSGTVDGTGPELINEIQALVDEVEQAIFDANDKIYQIGKANPGMFSGYLQANGTVHVPTAAAELATEYMDAAPGDVFILKTDSPTTGFYCVLANGTYTRTVLEENTVWEVTVPTGGTALAFSFETNGTVTDYDIYHLQSVTDTVELVNVLAMQPKIDFTFANGYLNADGTVHEPGAQTLEKYTEKVRVHGGDKIYLDFRLNGILDYGASQLSWCAYNEFKKDGTVTRTTFPVPTNSPTRTNHKYALIELADDTEYFAFSFRTYGLSYSVDAYYIINAVDLNTRLDGVLGLQSALNALLLEPSIILENPGTKLLASGETKSTASKVGTSNFYAVNPGDTLYYKLSTINGDLVLAVYDSSYNIVASVAGQGYDTMVEGDYTFSNGEAFIRVNGATERVGSYELAYNGGQRTDGVTSGAVENPFKRSPYYGHTLIEKINGNNVIIPSESIWNVQLDARLGFSHTEGNVHATSDGKYVVMHGVSNAFGNQVEHIDGTTDISAIRFDAVTLAWIKENVRYKSIYPKYRVAPPSLEEWLMECRRNGILPVATANTQEMADAISSVMGKDNYIGYNAQRAFTSGMIMHYTSALATKDAILDYCDNIKPPFMLCIGNSISFTDAEIKEIAEAVHMGGYLIGVAGCYTGEAEWQRVRNLGFDFSASGWDIPDIVSGNICNLSSGIDFADFNTDGTVTDGALALAAGQTVTPGEAFPAEFIAGGSLHITFTGTLTVSIGSRINESYTADGSMWFSTYFMNESPTFTLTAAANTTISDITYKASKM